MRRLVIVAALFLIPTMTLAGFKAKSIKSKQPEKFQARTVLAGVTIASDLLLNDKEQTEFFYKELNSSKILPLRLAIFNNSGGEILIPSDGIRLIGPDGKELPVISADLVAQAVLQGSPPISGKGNSPTQVSVDPTATDPRYDPRDPRYDPRADPTNTGRDPRMDPTDPRYDPRLDPTNPRYDPSVPRNRGYSVTKIGLPAGGVVLNPTGPGGGDYDEITKRLIEKDFSDKAYTADPVMPKMVRDRFLYFQFDERPTGIKGFELHLPGGQGLPEVIKIIF